MSSASPVATRAVTLGLHEQFAAFSGDWNPMHMDPISARRTQAGMPVVHGVHTLLWALDALTGSGQLTGLASLKVRFLKWVYLGDQVSLFVLPGDDPNRLSIQASVLEMVVLTADIHISGEQPKLQDVISTAPAAPLARPLDLSFAELEGKGGPVWVPSAETASQLFPALAALVGGASVSEIAACSYIVGMEAPGLHSMFSRLDLRLATGQVAGTQGSLDYLVDYRDERFQKIRIAVSGSSIAGKLEAFVRAAPTRQAGITALTEMVDPLEFEGMKALVVGGSRGLGELASKLIAAGGGVPTITYVLGKNEAEAVVEEIRSADREANAMPYDVRSLPASQFEDGVASFTHVLYFATNLIGRPKNELVSQPFVEDFLQFYVFGFYNLCKYLIGHRPAGDGKLVVYYPSTVFIDERPEGMTEYAMVKAAGEQMCLDMNQSFPGLEIYCTRLPKMSTDQTASVLPSKTPDAAEVMLPVLRTLMKMSMPAS